MFIESLIQLSIPIERKNRDKCIDIGIGCVNMEQDK